MRSVLEYFSEATGATINYASSENYEQQIVIDTQAGSPPNIAILPQPGLIQDLASKGLLVPLDDATATFVKDNYGAGQSWVDLGTYKDKVTQALPAHGSRLFTVTPHGSALGFTAYEAEASSNTLAGNASVADCSACSGGKKVGNLYVGGKVTVNDVVVAKAGTYQIKVAYVSGDARSVLVSAGDGGATSHKLPSTGDWGTVNSVYVPVKLKAGTNTVVFDSGTGYAPDIDRIDVPKSL